MAQPEPWKLTSAILSSSTLSQTRSWSPQRGLYPSAERDASGISRKFRGDRLWSRMMLW